jgi:hypothetical protein
MMLMQGAWQQGLQFGEAGKAADEQENHLRSITIRSE